MAPISSLSNESLHAIKFRSSSVLPDGRRANRRQQWSHVSAQDGTGTEGYRTRKRQRQTTSRRRFRPRAAVWWARKDDASAPGTSHRNEKGRSEGWDVCSFLMPDGAVSWSSTAQHALGQQQQHAAAVPGNKTAAQRRRSGEYEDEHEHGSATSPSSTPVESSSDISSSACDSHARLSAYRHMCCVGDRAHGTRCTAFLASGLRR
eukprot:303852-Rhodomonas_salina.4